MRSPGAKKGLGFRVLCSGLWFFLWVWGTFVQHLGFQVFQELGVYNALGFLRNRIQAAPSPLNVLPKCQDMQQLPLGLDSRTATLAAFMLSGPCSPFNAKTAKGTRRKQRMEGLAYIVCPQGGGWLVLDGFP